VAAIKLIIVVIMFTMVLLTTLLRRAQLTLLALTTRIVDGRNTAVGACWRDFLARQRVRDAFRGASAAIAFVATLEAVARAADAASAHAARRVVGALRTHVSAQGVDVERRRCHALCRENFVSARAVDVAACAEFCTSRVRSRTIRCFVLPAVTNIQNVKTIC
jgi:hypothetical protein